MASQTDPEREFGSYLDFFELVNTTERDCWKSSLSELEEKGVRLH